MCYVCYIFMMLCLSVLIGAVVGTLTGYILNKKYVITKRNKSIKGK